MKYIKRRPIKFFLDKRVFNESFAYDTKGFTQLKIAEPVSLSAVEGLFVHQNCSGFKFLTPSNIFGRSLMVCADFVINL